VKHGENDCNSLFFVIKSRILKPSDNKVIQERIDTLRRRIAGACLRAGREPSEVTLIAVSKTFGTEDIAEARREGIADFGENYIQELREKREVLGSSDIRWHFVGHLQTNKIRYIADWIHLIHSVDTLRLARALSDAGLKIGRAIPFLVEVNTTGESSKFGCAPSETPGLIKEAAKLSSVRIDGLMTMGPLPGTPGDTRRAFRALGEMAGKLRGEGYPLPHLSMGMTGDFEIAIAEGATLVRVGTAIFGTRAGPGSGPEH